MPKLFKIYKCNLDAILQFQDIIIITDRYTTTKKSVFVAICNKKLLPHEKYDEKLEG